MSASPASDPALLLELQAQHGVETDLAPSAMEYASHLREAVLDAIGNALGDVGLLEPLGQVLQVGIGVVLPLVLLVVVLRWLLSGRRRRAARAQPEPSLAPLTAPDPEAALTAALAMDQPRLALAALWAWLGQALSGAGRGRWSTDQTEREFITTVQRAAPGWPGLSELEALRHEVVVGVYGPRPPPIEAVAALVPRARALISGSGSTGSGSTGSGSTGSGSTGSGSTGSGSTGTGSADHGPDGAQP